MEILGNIIKDDEIIGCSAIATKLHPDQKEAMCDTLCFTFVVFTTQNQIRINSRWFRKEDENVDYYMYKFKAKFCVEYKKIFELTHPGSPYPYYIISFEAQTLLKLSQFTNIPPDNDERLN